MKILLKTFLSIAMVSCLCTTPVFAATADNPQSWYIKRNDSHKQPATALSASELDKYGAYCVDTLHGDGCEDKVIYLTFDAGYENGNIAKILDALKEESVPAAFFVLKNMITKEKALVERMNNEGHLVCNHTMTHKDMSHAGNDTLTSELKGLEALYTKTTGQRACQVLPTA